MNQSVPEKYVAALGYAGAALALLLLAAALLTGASQEPFEAVHPLESYTEMLKDKATGLRLALMLDNFFVVVYAAFFVVLAAALRGQAESYVVNAALFAILLTAALDSAENMHLLTMLSSTEQGLPIQLPEVQWQMTLSHVKFHSSYLALFLFGFAFPRETVIERLLVRLFWYVQLPVGVLIYTAPAALLKPLLLLRGLFFIVGFTLTAEVFRKRARL